MASAFSVYALPDFNHFNINSIHIIKVIFKRYLKIIHRKVLLPLVSLLLPPRGSNFDLFLYADTGKCEKVFIKPLPHLLARDSLVRVSRQSAHDSGAAAWSFVLFSPLSGGQTAGCLPILPMALGHFRSWL